MTAPDLSGQVALVAGASGGLGGPIAAALRAAGARVGGLDVRRPERETPEEVFIPCDIGDERAVANAVAEARTVLGGEPSILVNSAAVVARRGLEDTASEWDDALRVNLTGAFYLIREVIGGMRRAGYGRIVQLASLVAETGGAGNVAAYAASKAGLVGLAKAAAAEFAADGVTSNVVSPAWIDSGMFGVPGATPDQVPVRRMGTPEDVVSAVLYLVAPAAGFVTGQVVQVNGGLRFG
ncbi:SDR family NAD(P)-dependent oxidoreductase [Amycolatopsis rubida]|uniref:3-oxoacyl-[acyl-carrier protein] reductase n=1 Tax=Amycolatopsis rubida TaxID=112413 RepID=A0A1I5SJE3_9PSEU|nr:SDR family oxidoreductase [Amycolatopsis rubida]SFP70812.1 3-oxoacyl-[acyl-carrier protein] reductase [Amycolatopsis rubida]